MFYNNEKNKTTDQTFYMILFILSFGEPFLLYHRNTCFFNNKVGSLQR
jgi:hypothetical protein